MENREHVHSCRSCSPKERTNSKAAQLAQSEGRDEAQNTEKQVQKQMEALEISYGKRAGMKMCEKWASLAERDSSRLNCFVVDNMLTLFEVGL